MVTVTFSENRTRLGLLFSLAFLAAVNNEDFLVDCENKTINFNHSYQCGLLQAL
jgi:hypothetical protein